MKARLLPVSPHDRTEAIGGLERNLTLSDIELSYLDRKLGAGLEFRLDEMQGAVPEGQPATLRVSGGLQERPFELALEAGSLAQLRDPDAAWPLSLRGDISGTPLEARGELVRHTGPEVQAELTIGEVDFGALLAFLGVIEGLEASMERVSARVRLRGGSLSDLVSRSELALRLEQGELVLRDANTGARLPLRIMTGEIGIEPDTLRALDTRIAVAVESVLSGRDELGRGSLELRIEGGRLRLAPLELALPGGGAELAFEYFPRATDLELGLKARVDQLDYGILAHRIDPESEVGGRLSLDLDLRSRGGSIEDLLVKGSGRFDFGLWPEQLSAELFELWAVNIISTQAWGMDAAPGLEPDGTGGIEAMAPQPGEGGADAAQGEPVPERARDAQEEEPPGSSAGDSTFGAFEPE